MEERNRQMYLETLEACSTEQIDLNIAVIKLAEKVISEFLKEKLSTGDAYRPTDEEYIRYEFTPEEKDQLTCFNGQSMLDLSPDGIEWGEESQSAYLWYRDQEEAVGIEWTPAGNECILIMLKAVCLK